MTDPVVLVALISGVVTIALAVLTSIVVPGINRRLDEAKVERAEVKVALVGAALKSEAKLEEIHALTNSNLAAVNKRLDAALEEISRLGAHIEAMHKEKEAKL